MTKNNKPDLTEENEKALKALDEEIKRVIHCAIEKYFEALKNLARR